MAVAGAVKSGRNDGTPASGNLSVTVTVEDEAAFIPAGATVVQVPGLSAHRGQQTATCSVGNCRQN